MQPSISIRNDLFDNTQTRCGVVNAATAGAQLVVFTVVAAFVGGPVLVGMRWLLGSATAIARFFLNRTWVFGATEERKRVQGLRFALMSLASVTLGTFAFAILLALAPEWLHPLFVQIASMGLVWVGFGYPVTRGWVFPEKTDAGAAS